MEQRIDAALEAGVQKLKILEVENYDVISQWRQGMRSDPTLNLSEVNACCGEMETSHYQS